MSTKRIKRQSWMTSPEVKKIFAALGAENTRFVGGCVRDAIIGRPTADIDIATRHKPKDATGLLEDSGIRVIPTGVKHGTVTAVLGKQAFEITTLRKDISCDGRHARVEFSDSWEEDAARRDFTMNALFMDLSGNIYDYFNGIADLKAGKVHFIGKAEERIKEDYLRILRLFRFHSFYGKKELEKSAIKACGKDAAYLKKLSGERICNEMLKLLASPDPSCVLKIMEESGVIRQIVPNLRAKLDLAALKQLVAIEKKAAIPDMAQHPIIRLAVILPANFKEKSAQKLAESWKFSNSDKKHLLELVAPPLAIEPNSDEAAQKRAYRKSGYQLFRHLVVLQWAKNAKNSKQAKPYKAMLALSDKWTPPHLPVRGQDLVNMGIKPGQKIGAILKEIEKKWEDGGYKFSRRDILKTIKKEYVS